MNNTRKIVVKSKDDEIEFEINPTELKVERAQLHNKKEVGTGEHVRMKGPSLSKVTLSTFVPHDKSEFVSPKRKYSQKDQIKKLLEWKKSSQILTLYISGIFSSKVVITALTTSVKEGDKDVYISLDFLEYRKLVTKAIDNKEDGDKDQTSEKPKYYIVVKGDCLYHIAKKFYGKGSRWREIYDTNKKIIGNNPNLIFPGQKLMIP